MANQFRFKISEDLEGGVYANIAGVWNSPYEFTIDFAATLPAEQGSDAQGNPVTVVPCRIVSRVKLPPAAIFDLMRALNDQMTAYETQHGPIKRPGEEAPLVPPDDLIASPPPDDGGDDGDAPEG